MKRKGHESWRNREGRYPLQKKMKLSLLFPSWTNHFGAYKSAAKKISTFPPLNLCIIAALAKQEGWDVQIVDANVEELSTQALIGRVKKYK